MYRADLHIHTTASDGVYSPSQVVLRAKDRHVNLIAISDHDSIAGIFEAENAAREHQLAIIPAVEISTGKEGAVHVLGFGANSNSSALRSLLSEMALEREERAQRIIERLQYMGLRISMDDVPAGRGAVKGRAQIARALVKLGYVRETQEAFDRYIGEDCGAYVPRKQRETGEMIAFLAKEKMVPVLAHPGLIHMDYAHIEQNIRTWKACGLQGIEVYHPAHLPSQYSYWHQCAQSLDLLITGGSDFHEPGDKHADIGDMLPLWKNCHADAAQLLNLIQTISSERKP